SREGPDRYGEAARRATRVTVRTASVRKRGQGGAMTNTPSPPTTTEREDLVATLARHRGFLLHTADGLTEEQLRTASTVSVLTIAGILKHVADTEEGWFRFAVDGAEAFAGSGVYESDVDWDAVDAEAAGNDGDRADSGWQDDRFTVTEADTLEALRARVAEVARTTEQVLRTADLDRAHALPAAPWFEPGTRWTVRRIALLMVAEISQHAGHADI